MDPWPTGDIVFNYVCVRVHVCIVCIVWPWNVNAECPPQLLSTLLLRQGLNEPGAH